MSRVLVWIVLTLLAGSSAAEQDFPKTVDSEQPVVVNRLEQIERSDLLRVCIWPDYYSISYRDPRTYELTGIEINLAQSLADDLSVKLEFVDSSFANLSKDLLSNACDLSMFAIAILPARQAVVRFTDPHLFSDVIGITTKTNRRIHEWADIDQPGVVVSVTQGTLHEPLMRERLKHAKLLVSQTAQARERDVESGRADVFMTDYPYVRRMLDTTDWARQVDPPKTYHVSEYAWAMAPGDDVWFDRVQAFLKQIKQDGRLESAARQYHLDPIVVRD